jgi:hypothetical protein
VRRAVGQRRERCPGGGCRRGQGPGRRRLRQGCRRRAHPRLRTAVAPGRVRRPYPPRNLPSPSSASARASRCRPWPPSLGGTAPACCERSSPWGTRRHPSGRILPAAGRTPCSASNRSSRCRTTRSSSASFSSAGRGAARERASRPSRSGFSLALHHVQTSLPTPGHANLPIDDQTPSWQNGCL